MNLIDCQGYFVPVVLGLIFGEILFQSAHHMGQKWRRHFGAYFVCLEHSVLYTAAMVLFLYLFAGVQPLNLYLIGSIAIGHFIFEKFPFAFMWLQYLKCEYNPMFTYYQSKLGEDAVNTEEWFNYIGSRPTVEANEDLMTASTFYITEFVMVGRLLQFIITFFTVIALDLMHYI